MFSIATIIIYIATWVYHVHSILRKEPINPTKILAAIGVGLATHAIAVYFLLFSHASGIQLGIFKISSLFFFVINTIVCISCLKKPLHNLFLILLPASALSLAISLMLGSSSDSVHSLDGGIIAHILLSILAYSLLTIASLQALLLAYQNKMLKAKHPAGVMRLLPPLQTVESLMFELVWGGMIFLTLSIATGFIFIDDFLAQKLSHKTAFHLYLG